MRLRVGLLTLGAVTLAVLGGGSPPPLLADTAGRHDGVVKAVDPRSGVVTLSEMVAGGRRRTLRIQVPPDTRIVRSERLPDGRVRDLAHPFQDRSIGVADIRPGDFLVVELAKPGKPDTARSMVVTLEPSPR